MSTQIDESRPYISLLRHYSDSDGVHVGTINVSCIYCKDGGVLITKPISALQDWLNGAPVQEVFPGMPPEEREMLISGVCPSCWDKMLEGGDSDE